MSDYKDILQGNGSERNTLSEEKLLAYLEGRLPDAERQAVEEWLSKEGMESDALEGLHSLSVEETKALKSSLHGNLQKVLHKKRKPRRVPSPQRWTWTAIAIILLLTILGYAVIYLLNHPLK